MMHRSWVRNTIALACFTFLAVGLCSHAQDPSVELVRFRPFSLLTRDRSADRDSEKDEASSAMKEPVPAPPSTLGTQPQVSFKRSSQQSVDPLILLTERAIEKTSLRYLDANQHRPWQITHGLLALRRNLVLRDGRRTVNAIDWISQGGKFRNQYWFVATEYGAKAQPYNGVPYEFEGHVNQTLALLAMSNLPLTHEFEVARGRTVTMADMVRHAQMTVSTREEITWTLWFLTHYLDIDSEWVAADGEPWSLEELVRLQTKAKVVGTPCGGSHGLFALAYARNAYLYKHGTLRGVWFEADQKIKQHIELAKSLQNRDGSFSTEMFKGPGQSRDFNERTKASGHMLEWLMMALPNNQLNESWVRRAVASIATDLVHQASRPAECGPLYHALNALMMYHDRVAPRSLENIETPSRELALPLAPLPPTATAATPVQTPPAVQPQEVPIAKDDMSAPPTDETALTGPAIPSLESAEAAGDSSDDAPEANPTDASPAEPVRIVIDPNEVREIR